MTKYAISDIHGCYDKYSELLNKIKFSTDDELYILGDIFHRGSDELEIYEHIISHENIHLIKGNHEFMVENYFDNEGFKSTKDLEHLILKYPKEDLRIKLIYEGTEYQKALYNYLKSLPLYMVIENYILVHAGLIIPKYDATIKEIINYNKEENFLWYRNQIGNEREHCKYKIICGHTPVISMGDKAEILRRKSYIYIDCGCSFESYGGKLGCLDLDNNIEYYV